MQVTRRTPSGRCALSIGCIAPAAPGVLIGRLLSNLSPTHFLRWPRSVRSSPRVDAPPAEPFRRRPLLSEQPQTMFETEYPSRKRSSRLDGRAMSMLPHWVAASEPQQQHAPATGRYCTGVLLRVGSFPFRARCASSSGAEFVRSPLYASSSSSAEEEADDDEDEEDRPGSTPRSRSRRTERRGPPRPARGGGGGAPPSRSAA